MFLRLGQSVRRTPWRGVKLRSEASPESLRDCAQTRTGVVARRGQEISTPSKKINKKNKIKKIKTSERKKETTRQRNISSGAALFFSRSHTKQVWQFMEQEAAASPSVKRGCCIKSCLRSLLLWKLHLLSLQMWIDVSLMANSCSG